MGKRTNLCSLGSRMGSVVKALSNRCELSMDMMGKRELRSRFGIYYIGFD
jgi:hypothetical protein